MIRKITSKFLSICGVQHQYQPCISPANLYENVNVLGDDFKFSKRTHLEGNFLAYKNHHLRFFARFNANNLQLKWSYYRWNTKYMVLEKHSHFYKDFVTREDLPPIQRYLMRGRLGLYELYWNGYALRSKTNTTFRTDAIRANMFHFEKRSTEIESSNSSISSSYFHHAKKFQYNR